MDDDEIQSSSGMLPVALAVLAIALGGAGLYFGLTANQRINPIGESVAAGTTGVAELADEVNALGTRFEELAVKTDELFKTLNRVRAYGNQSEQAIKKLAGELNLNREQIVKTAETLNELASKGFRSPPVASTNPSPASNEDAPTGAAPSAAGGVYSIAGGDTFAKIAAKTGVSLQALIDANPGVDPRRLQIGQQITIPSN